MSDQAQVSDREYQELVERVLGLDDPAPALLALERARTAWARVHDQLSLDLGS